VPKFLEAILAKAAARKGLKGPRAKAYVYGTMQNIGAMRGSRETAKGRAMERKHQRDTGGGHASKALSARYPD